MTFNPPANMYEYQLEVRTVALNQAVRFLAPYNSIPNHVNKPSSTDVVDMAKIFEAYITGGSE